MRYYYEVLFIFLLLSPSQRNSFIFAVVCFIVHLLWGFIGNWHNTATPVSKNTVSIWGNILRGIINDNNIFRGNDNSDIMS
jgi:hypothetical protein